MPAVLSGQYVVGQDFAKKVMSVAVYNHYKRVLTDSESEDGIELQNDTSRVIEVFSDLRAILSISST